MASDRARFQEDVAASKVEVPQARREGGDPTPRRAGQRRTERGGVAPPSGPIREGDPLPRREGGGGAAATGRGGRPGERHTERAPIREGEVAAPMCSMGLGVGEVSGNRRN